MSKYSFIYIYIDIDSLDACYYAHEHRISWSITFVILLQRRICAFVVVFTIMKDAKLQHETEYLGILVSK